jgi:hypothetical protein
LTITDTNTPEDYLSDFYRRLFDIRAPSNNDHFVVENIDNSKQFYDFEVRVIDHSMPGKLEIESHVHYLL